MLIINFFVFTFYVSPKLERSAFFTLTFQVLVVVGVCNQFFWYLDSNFLKLATVIRVFFVFFSNWWQFIASWLCRFSRRRKKQNYAKRSNLPLDHCKVRNFELFVWSAVFRAVGILVSFCGSFWRPKCFALFALQAWCLCFSLIECEFRSKKAFLRTGAFSYIIFRKFAILRWWNVCSGGVVEFCPNVSVRKGE